MYNHNFIIMFVLKQKKQCKIKYFMKKLQRRKWYMIVLSFDYINITGY